ncbi:Haloacid Dehalogenase Superfamily Class (subfamily) IIA [Corynebacterium pollutisoli]|uniref:Haloacid Dehalogenase Superfamily Class (Subfamily) IIA n=1 Tax=Corynebacterium pollutisoli TaxID=1610489 RepID=A0A1X7JNV8_9CORY|nr:HAD-IIA family hydrolase [Corynebacterium pollutisoli]SMG29573.1 Haloacid Dehalogenase Superfamily Class (subfamily) IIA [Corynebacterium pollutisoli]
MSLLRAHDALLLDLDGTVWEGGRAIDGAVETITAAGVPSVYITNNAMRAPQVVAEKLQAIGLDATDTDVVTAAQAAIDVAAEHLQPGDPVYIVGTPSFKELAQAAGYRVVDSADEQPKAVLQGLDPEATWAVLSEAALAIRNGATYVASNLDTTLPDPRGLLVGNGSMVAAVVSATGVTPVSAGKPQGAMFVTAAQRVGAQAPLTVGDRLDTDIEGANAAGMPSLHVLTGVSGHIALLEAVKEQRPTYIAADMRALHEDPATLRPGAQGGFTARVDGNDILLERGHAESTSVQALRTVLEVAWSMKRPADLIRPVGDHAARAVSDWW